MKKIILALMVLVIVSACRKDEYDLKEGPSLPTIQNLKSEAAANNQLKLSWTIPAQIPEAFERPLRIAVETSKIIGPTKSIVVFNATLEEEATSMLMDIPTEPGEYHIVMRLNGTTKLDDKNYSRNVFSLGQTLVYKK